jgi:death on curing protein
MNYLSVDDVLIINKEVLRGQAALRDRNLLESAVARPMTSAFGEDAYPTLVEKAAALFHSLILNHPFVDGNKRTATAATILFLQANGLKITWDEDAAFNFIVETAEGKHNVSVIARWLSENTEAVEK